MMMLASSTPSGPPPPWPGDDATRMASGGGRSHCWLWSDGFRGCHGNVADAADTDWGEIAALYGLLRRYVPSAVVELNRAVAVAMADGPAAGLRLVDALARSGELDGYHLLHATRA